MLSVIVINKGERKYIIFDVAVPDHIGVSDKEKQKVAKYQDLKREIKKIRNIRIVIVVPLIAVALGSITKKLDEWLGVIQLLRSHNNSYIPTARNAKVTSIRIVYEKTVMKRKVLIGVFRTHSNINDKAFLRK